MMKMSYQDIMDMVQSIGLPFAYDHFNEGESPAPPFVIFRFPGDANFSADGVAYIQGKQLDIELYTDYKDQELEDRIAEILEDNGIYYDRTETWIPTEKLYEVLYRMEVYYADTDQ